MNKIRVMESSVAKWQRIIDGKENVHIVRVEILAGAARLLSVVDQRILLDRRTGG